MKLSLSASAKQVKKSKSVISEAIKKGRLSAVRNGNRFEIDPAELFRVFPQGEQSVPSSERPTNMLVNEINELRAKLEVAQAEKSAMGQNLDDLRGQLEWAKEREQKLLAAPASRGFLGRIFG